MASEKKESPYLTGKLLLAMPSMGDPRFHRAVIFMCAHDANGAMGLVINHTLPGLEFSQLLTQLKIASDINVNFRELPIMAGGPVESARGFLLHSAEFSRKDTVKIDTFGITGTVEALREIVTGGGPGQILFILGYAGWSAGQLDREIQDNAWLVVDADPEIIFHAQADEKWEMACAKLGINPAMLSGEAGRA